MIKSSVNKICCRCDVKGGEKMKIKTIDVNAKEWFDKINGNSYFSAVVTVNYCMGNQITFKIPFQYGYDSMYEFVAFEELKKRNIIPSLGEFEDLYWRYYKENDIIYRHSIRTNCLKEVL
jgi:hypothetical protein